MIVAYNADNISSRKEISVVRSGEDEIDMPPRRYEKSDAVAVVIGISKYESKDIPPTCKGCYDSKKNTSSRRSASKKECRRIL